MAWRRSIAEWTEGDSAYISAVFTWQLPKVWQRAAWLAQTGYAVNVGGPALYVQTSVKQALQSFAQVGGDLDDAVSIHNPNATFASRGCPVGCSFCIVPSMEGLEFTLIDDFPVRPVLCDNNLSALPDDFQEHIVKRYQDTGTPLLNANSGFEPRTFDEAVFERWKPVNRGPWRFALDDQGDVPHVARVLEMLKDVPAYRKRVYVLIGNEPVASCMERIQMVIDGGAEPFVQPEMKLNALVKKPWVKRRLDWNRQLLTDVARWANRWIYRQVDFPDYQRHLRGAVL